jgi:hypothetical protein
VTDLELRSRRHNGKTLASFPRCRAGVYAPGVSSILAMFITFLTVSAPTAESKPVELAEDENVWTAGVGIRESFREPWLIDGLRVVGGLERQWWRVDTALYGPLGVHRSRHADREYINRVVDESYQYWTYIAPYEVDLFATSLSFGVGLPRRLSQRKIQVRPRFFLGAEVRWLRLLWLGGSFADDAIELTWTTEREWWTISPLVGGALTFDVGERFSTSLSFTDRVRWTTTPTTCRFNYPDTACGQAVTTWVEQDLTLTLDVVVAL